jgi:hypothetical protein
MPTLGFDAFITDLGVAEDKICRVCGAACDVQRSVYGPLRFTEGLTTRHQYHDRFVCPHADAPWHRQALRLAQEIHATASPRLARLIQQDLDEVLAGVTIHNAQAPRAASPRPSAPSFAA